jgi:hypothetical protein
VAQPQELSSQIEMAYSKSTFMADKTPVKLLEANKNDVVCGGNKITNNFVGNKRFRVWIDLHSKAFSKAPNPEDRVKIARSVVNTVQSCVPQGRFLSMNPQSGAWYDVGYEKAVEITMDVLTREVMTTMHPGALQVKPPSCATPSKPNTYASMAA